MVSKRIGNHSPERIRIPTSHQSQPVPAHLQTDSAQKLRHQSSKREWKMFLHTGNTHFSFLIAIGRQQPSSAAGDTLFPNGFHVSSDVESDRDRHKTSSSIYRRLFPIQWLNIKSEASVAYPLMLTVQVEHKVASLSTSDDMVWSLAMHARSHSEVDAPSSVSQSVSVEAIRRWLHWTPFLHSFISAGFIRPIDAILSMMWHQIVSLICPLAN